jgi:hypothetical protein
MLLFTNKLFIAQHTNGVKIRNLVTPLTLTPPLTEAMPSRTSLEFSDDSSTLLNPSEEQNSARRHRGERAVEDLLLGDRFNAQCVHLDPQLRKRYFFQSN